MPKEGVPYKFDEDVQIRFLERYAATGRKVHSAQYAGVRAATVDAHRKTHEDFDELYQDARAVFAESVAEEVHRRGVRGWDEPVWKAGMRALEPVLDDDGNPVMAMQIDSETGKPIEDDKGRPRYRTMLRPAVVRRFSDRLLELEAKRFEPGYRDKQTVDMNVTGGVLAVPMGNPEDWEKRYGGKSEPDPEPEDEGRRVERS